MEEKDLKTTEEGAELSSAPEGGVSPAHEGGASPAHEGSKLSPTQKKRLIVALVAIAFIYLAGAAYSTFMFLPNTSLRGVNISGLSATAANEKLKGEGLFLNVEQKAYNGRDVITDVIDLKEVALAEMDYDTGALLKEQDKFFWFKSFFVKTDFQESKGAGKFDENRLKLVVGQLYSQRRENVKPARSAKLEPKKNGILVIPETEGNEVERNVAVDAVVRAARNAVRGGGTQTVDLVALCKEPEVRVDTDYFRETKKKMEEVAVRTITLNIGSENVQELYGESIVDLLEFSGSKLVIDEDAVDKFVTGLHDEYYVCRYEYIKTDELKELLEKALVTSKDEIIEVPWYINYPYPGCRGNGSPSYVEISIGAQTLWYYENNELILSSSVVTGIPKKHPTPRGYFSVVEKVTNARLIGRDKEYDVKVNYWMGIESSGYYGMHDATYRGAFGGDIYINNGSHGCINLPYSVAQALYARTYIGTEVYIY